MKQIHKIFGVIVLVFIVMGGASAQDIPPIGLGLRGSPDGIGVTGKFSFNERVNVEAMLNRSNGLYQGFGPSTVAVGLLEYNFLFPDPNLRVYVGPGMHVAWARYFDEARYPSYYRTRTFAGLDMIAGIEYVFERIPVGLSLDVKPGFNFYNSLTGFPANNIGMGLRYYFGNWEAHRNYRIPVTTGR